MHPVVSSRSKESVLIQPDLLATFALMDPHFRSVSAGWSYPRHDHPYFELCLIDSGEQHTRLTGRTLVQKAGDLLLLCPFDAHGSTVPQAASWYCIHFDVDEMALRRLLCRTGSRLFDADSELAKRLREPLKELKRFSSPNAGASLAQRLELTSLLFRMFAEMADTLMKEADAMPAVSQATLQTASRLAEQIERAVEEGSESFSIESAIRKLGYNPDHGNAMFRQVYGMSARQYRSSMQFRRAKILLLDHTLTINDVAARLCYADGMRFSRQFKRWSGMSPSSFRTEMGAQSSTDA